jgi:hypothetical protein
MRAALFLEPHRVAAAAMDERRAIKSLVRIGSCDARIVRSIERTGRTTCSSRI